MALAFVYKPMKEQNYAVSCILWISGSALWATQNPWRLVYSKVRCFGFPLFRISTISSTLLKYFNFSWKSVASKEMDRIIVQGDRYGKTVKSSFLISGRVNRHVTLDVCSRAGSPRALPQRTLLPHLCKFIEGAFHLLWLRKRLHRQNRPWSSWSCTDKNEVEVLWTSPVLPNPDLTQYER